MAHPGEHADDVGNQQAEPDDQHGRALHVEPAQPVEAGEREPDPSSGNAERAGAEHTARDRGPASAPTGPVSGSGRRVRPTNSPATSAVMAPSRRRELGAHTGTGARVTRRSWKWGSTG